MELACSVDGLNGKWQSANAARGEQTNNAEYLRICWGIKPPLLPDKPVAITRPTHRTPYMPILKSIWIQKHHR
jgi:hypothetical protein